MPSLIPLLMFYSSFLTFPFNLNNPLFFSSLIFLKTFVVFLFFFLIGHTMQLVGSQFPTRGWNLCPLQCKHRVLTTRPPGKFHSSLTFNLLFVSGSLQSVFFSLRISSGFSSMEVCIYSSPHCPMFNHCKASLPKAFDYREKKQCLPTSACIPRTR